MTLDFRRSEVQLKAKHAFQRAAEAEWQNRDLRQEGRLTTFFEVFFWLLDCSIEVALWRYCAVVLDQ